MILNFIIKCCKYTSMMKNNRYGRIYGAYMTTGPFLTITGIVLSIFATNEIRYLTSIFGFMFCVSFGFSLQILFIFQRKLLLQIINRVTGIHSNYPDFINGRITKIAEKQAEERFTMEVLLFIWSSSLWVICPYLYLVTNPAISLDHPDVQVIPFFYKIWKTNSIFSFVLKKCFEFIISAAGLCVYYVFTIIFITYTVANLEAHTKEINSQLINIIETDVRKYMKFQEFSLSRTQKDSCFIFERISNRTSKTLYERSINEQFVKIITYHNFIHSYTADVTKFLHKPMTALFAWYISSTVLFAYAFIQVPDDIIYFMKISSLVIHGNTALRLFCNISEIIYHMNEKIMDSFYNTSWYYLLPKSRKNFSIILALCQKKYEVKSFGMYIVNLNLFIFAVRIVYSVMNMILMVQKK